MQADAIIAKLPATQAELRAALAVSNPDVLSTALHILRDGKQVRVGGWRGSEAIWHAGAGADVARPVAVDVVLAAMPGTNATLRAATGYSQGRVSISITQLVGAGKIEFDSYVRESEHCKLSTRWRRK